MTMEPRMEDGGTYKSGILLVISAYVFWGLLPIFWKSLQIVPPLEILGHRVVWSFVFLAAIQLIRNRREEMRTKLRDPKTRLTFIATSALIGFNWFLYVWAINSGFVVETSLGYFINPLVSVFLGVIILREHLSRVQWLAVGVAALGVLYMTFVYGAFPWIALVLAACFGIYGLLRKIGSLGSLDGLTFETALLFLPSLAYLILLDSKGLAAFAHISLKTTVLLSLTGIVTAFPLLLFTASVRRIPLSTVGILQYILPTMLFLLGVFVYKETFSLTRLIGFIIIWIALFLFSWDRVVFSQKKTIVTQI
jgi:chloramphenicol-sensitive protein RarD